MSTVSKHPPDEPPNPGESERKKSAISHSIFSLPQYSHAELQKIGVDSGLLKYIIDKSVNEDFICSVLLRNLSAAACSYRLALLNAAEPTGGNYNVEKGYNCRDIADVYQRCRFRGRRGRDKGPRDCGEPE